MQISQNPTIEVFFEFEGCNGENTLSGVRLWNGSKNRLAVLAQEVFEHEYKRENIKRYLLTVFWPPARRRFLEAMKIDSHAIEVAAAHAFYGLCVGSLEWQEANKLNARNNGGVFKGSSIEDIAKRLEYRRDFARRWVARNRTRIDAWSAAIRTAA